MISVNIIPQFIQQKHHSIGTVDELIQLFKQLPWEKNHIYLFSETTKNGAPDVD